MFQLVSDGFKLFQVVSDGFKLFQMVSDGFKLFQVVSDGFKLFQLLADMSSKKNLLKLLNITPGTHMNFLPSSYISKNPRTIQQ